MSLAMVMMATLVSHQRSLTHEQSLSVSTQPPVPIQAWSALCANSSAHSSTFCASAVAWSGERSLLLCESIEVAL